MNPGTIELILKLIDFAVLAAKLAPAVQAQYAETRAKVDAMVAEGRDPTPEELAELTNGIDELRGKLHN